MTNDLHDPHSSSSSSSSDQDDFWHGEADWTPTGELPRVEAGAGNSAGSPLDAVRHGWNSLLGGDAPARRSHGTPSGGMPRPNTEVAAGAWSIHAASTASTSGRVDPALLRLGGLIIAVTLAIPLVLGFTSGSDDEALRTATPPPASFVAADERLPLEPFDDTTTEPSQAAQTTEGQVAVAPSAPADASSGDDAGDGGEGSSAPAPVAAAPQTSTTASPTTASPTTAAPTTAAPTTTVAACGSDYEIAAGDYWIRIADAAGVSLSALLAVNGASTDTNLVPGRSICLPPGASTPAPPPAPTAPSAPATTTPRNTTAPAATTPPTTAPRPTTTAAPRPPASPSDVVAIIRSVWPDELEERAITIAWRESNHRPEVDNGFCCYGLFQIYYSVHKGWLADMGIMSADDLRDPLANAQAAYRLYQRAGGWGPWSQTNY